MPTSLRSRFLQRLIVFALGLLGAVGAARADLVTGIWDPLFGSPFSNLGFRGVVVYDIPTGCFATNGQIFNTNPCANGAMSTVSTIVEFYDTTVAGQPTLGTLVFDPLAISVDYVDVSSGSPTGIGTGYAPWVAGTTTFETVSGFFFSVFLSHDQARMVWKPSGSQQTVEGAAGAGQLSNPAQVRFERQVVTTVPEPGSLALVGAALAAAAAAARRRRA